MKIMTKTLIIAALLSLPASGYAASGPKEHQHDQMVSGQSADMMQMMKEMKNMHTKMGDMMQKMSDPGHRSEMKKMHDQMGQMMDKMKKMHGGAGKDGHHQKGDKKPEHRHQGNGHNH